MSHVLDDLSGQSNKKPHLKDKEIVDLELMLSFKKIKLVFSFYFKHQNKFKFLRTKINLN